MVEGIKENDFRNIEDEMAIPLEQEKVLRDLFEEIEEKDLKVLFVLAPFEIDENEHKMSN